jgi:hypothetical protein
MIKELFKLNEEFIVDINKEWISTIAEFRYILRSDRGGIKGDADGRRKIKSRKIFTYIYHYCDYTSQFIDFPEHKRHKKALENAGLTDEDINQDVKDAIKKYNELQETQILRLLKSARRAIQQLEDYYDTVDFSERDVQGRIVHTPKSVMDSLSSLAKIIKSVSDLENEVKKELKEKHRARGDADLGLFENPESVSSFGNQPVNDDELYENDEE